MKQSCKITFLLLFVFGTTVLSAQTENNPWGIFIGVNAVDFFPTGADVVSFDGVVASDTFGDELFDIGENWNILSAISNVAVSKYVGDGFSFEVGGSLNQINKLGKAPADGLSFVSLDATVRYNLNYILRDKKHHWLDPYLGIGGGYYWLDNEGDGTFNANAGFNFWLNDRFALTLDTTYKTAFDQDGLDLFQHRAGIKFAFGGQDSDGDGIYDKNDECPDTPGTEEFGGCPDSDGDGIRDIDDECPGTAGLPQYNGCPDSDGDGIKDSEDECPNEAGTAENNGCPDSDNDGVSDNADNCPNEAGPQENKGCPWPDSDGDGVLDKDDQCPNEAGVLSQNGCPEIAVVTEVVQKELNEYAKTINFDTGKSSITKDSEEALSAILAILAEYPNAKFSVEGHTDSIGSASSNKTLSQKRADSVTTYLVNKGVDPSRLTSIGYGEEKPIATNMYKDGRAKNRRVEINLVK